MLLVAHYDGLVISFLQCSEWLWLKQKILFATGHAPPTVSDTKARFLQSYSKPVTAIYNNVVQELLVQMHFIRYGKNFEYSEVRCW